ncbi:MAG: hypothetical protein ACREMW_14755 [Gemmatimonadales bacterium]
MKLHVPELAPALGRLIVPRRLVEPWVPLDDLREALATRVLECAGAARRDAADDAPARALTHLSHEAWSGAWNEAVRRTAERVADALDTSLAGAARRVRMPRRKQRALALVSVERRAIAARFASGADHFEEALRAVTRSTDTLHRTWPADPADHAEWQEAQQLAARRLEAAWLVLETQVEAERTRWAPELEAINAWRPSLAPVFSVWIPCAALAIWLGLVLGGYLPAPTWLAALLDF